MQTHFKRCAGRMALIIPFAAFLFSPSVALAGPILGTALSTFAMLGGAGVTVDGSGSVITGSVGGCCNAFETTGYPAKFSDFGGTVYSSDNSVVRAAHDELLIARTALNLLPSITISSLDYQTLVPGVYSVSATDFTGTLTLDGAGNANALWVFLFASELTTASTSKVLLENTGAGAGVYWVVGSSANLGQDSVFAGNILAYSSVAATGTNVTDCGRLLTETASVTLAGTDTIGTGACSGILAGSSGLSGGGSLNEHGVFVAASYESTGGGGGSVPEPGTVPLLCVGFLALTLYGWQSRKRVA